MPDSPATRRFQDDVAEGPRGLSIPRPVTTTLRVVMNSAIDVESRSFEFAAMSQSYQLRDAGRLTFYTQGLRLT